MNIRAKFYCTAAVSEFRDQERVTFQPVTSGSEENKSFSKWTPAGSLDLTITNPELIGKFVVGQEYYLDITPANPQ